MKRDPKETKRIVARMKKARAAKAVLQVKAALREGYSESQDFSVKLAAILVASGARVQPIADKHLQRVAFTIGILRAVRAGMRLLNQGLAEWDGSMEVFETIDKTASAVADQVFPVLRSGPEFVFPMKFRNSFGLPSFRRDFRFAMQADRTEPIPFGPEFPMFAPADIDWDVLREISDDVVEMMTVSLRHVTELVGEERDQAARENAVELSIGFIALGKCVLQEWRPEVRTFLDMLACLDSDYVFGPTFDTLIQERNKRENS